MMDECFGVLAAVFVMMVVSTFLGMVGSERARRQALTAKACAVELPTKVRGIRIRRGWVSATCENSRHSLYFR